MHAVQALRAVIAMRRASAFLRRDKAASLAAKIRCVSVPTFHSESFLLAQDTRRVKARESAPESEIGNAAPRSLWPSGPLADAEGGADDDTG